jgi:hypothetical protein
MLIFPCLITDFIQSLPNVEAWKSYVDSGVGELERGFPAFKATVAWRYCVLGVHNSRVASTPDSEVSS